MVETIILFFALQLLSELVMNVISKVPFNDELRKIIQTEKPEQKVSEDLDNKRIGFLNGIFGQLGILPTKAPPRSPEQASPLFQTA